MRRLVIALLLIGCLGQPLVATSATMVSDSGYEIWADVIANGGDEQSGSANYSLSDTLGEQASMQTSSNYTGEFGFRTSSSNDAEVLVLSLSTASLNLGNLSLTETRSASHTLTVETNSASGVAVTASGSTLTTSGGATISAVGGTATSPAPGTNQFGFNVIYSAGTAPVATSQSPYNDTGKYAFQSGATIISSAGAINPTTFSVTYIANRQLNTSAGSYQATMTYTATANF